MSATVEAGSMAPDFTLPVDGGDSLTLSSLRGRSVVLYFYPKDDTPGCTTEAIDFTGLIGAFRAAGVAVVGVSKDSVARHEKFKAKHDLAVTLAADTDGTVCAAYGVWVEKTMYGRTSMGIERATFLIGPDGTVQQVWRKVKVKGHAAAVLAAAGGA